MMSRVFVALVLSLVLVVCAWAQAIRPGDRLKLTVKEEPQLNKEYTVNKDGIILVEFLGAVEVAGLSPEDAAKKIAAQLEKDRILRVATVKAERVGDPVATPEEPATKAEEQPEPPPAKEPEAETPKGSVVADGEGVVAARVDHLAGLTLSAFLSQLTLKEGADLTSVRLVSEGRVRIVDTTRSDNPESDPVLEPGDQITVNLREPTPEARVTVLGGVANPGEIVLRGETTLQSAIEAAGGPRGSYVKDGITLQRLDRTELKLDPLGTGLATLLATGDIVTVEVAAPRMYVAVEGAVRQPGFFVASEGLTLTEAMGLAGGHVREAQLERVQIVSSEPGIKPRTVNIRDIEQGYRGDVLLKAGDRVVVPGSKKRNDRTWLYAAGAVVAWYIFLR